MQPYFSMVFVLNSLTINYLQMHNISTNFDKFYQIVKTSLSHKIDPSGNLQFYPSKPKMNDCTIIALSICAEAIGIDSENHLWGKIKKDYSSLFPNLIDRSNFNRRRRRLRFFTHEVSVKISEMLSEGEDTFIVDSMPLPVCNIARQFSCKTGRETFETAPDKGFSAITQSYYHGYKMHLVTSVRGVFHSVDMTKASVHDIHFLEDIKYTKMGNATLIGDKGYISKEIKTDLFHTCNITLETPKRKNQTDAEKWHPIFRKSRKRIETLFSQLCDQMMFKRNYAKTFIGIATRVFTKIAAVSCLQSMNYENNKPLNHLKYALAV